MSKNVHWNEQVSQNYEKFRSQGSSLLTHIYPELNKLKIFRPKMNVLSIGPGGGWLEVVLAKDFDAQLTFVEPSEQFVETFKKQIAEFNLESNVEQIFTDKFENFQSQKKFDLVLAIHSWHYIGYEAVQLQKAISYLAPGGRFCIVQTSEKAFSKSLIDMLYPNGHFFITIEELSRYCNDYSLNHELINISKIRSVEKYIQNDQLSDYTKSWISMIGRISIDEISDSTQDSAKQIIRNFTHQGSIDDAWGVILFRN